MEGKHYYPSKDPLRKLRQEMRLRRFSPWTVKSYLYYINNFLIWSNKQPKYIKAADIRNYLDKLARAHKSASTLNSAYSSLQFYFGKIMPRRFFIHIPRAKKPQKLPQVLTQTEIKRLLGTIINVKHKLLLALMYSSGLRISEVVKLKVKDLDFANQILYVRQGKGNKDRQTILSAILLDVLQKYTNHHATNDYVFTSNRGSYLSQRAVQKVFSKALKQAKIKKDATCHSLRHSFATHLLENGTNIRYIQELLGHKRLETTQIYTKVASNKLKDISSPLDKFSKS